MNASQQTIIGRRTLLAGAGALMGAAATPAWATPAPNAVRTLSFVNLHTGDTFAGAYFERGAYVPDAMEAIAQVMRDHRSGDVHAIDPALLDQLSALKARVGATAPYQIISGYRSPASNAAMHARSNGVALRSLHMDGKAIDVRVRGVALIDLRDAAQGMALGGVGFYPTSDFVHLDTGRVRRWAGS